MSTSLDSSFDISGHESQGGTSVISESSGQYRIIRKVRSPRPVTPSSKLDISAASDTSVYSTPPADVSLLRRSSRESTPAGDSPEATFSTPPDVDAARGPRAAFATPGTVMPDKKHDAINRINRGILRPTGTPGSGNGVRFFPKNKYRVITPNSSAGAIVVGDVDTEVEPTPRPPSSPAPQSFLDRLRATASSSFSFTSASPDSPGAFFTASASGKDDSGKDDSVSTEASVQDDSWEAPGEEGEISMASASEASEFSSPMEKMLSEGTASPPFGGEPSFDHWMASIKVPSALPSPAATPPPISTTPPDEQPFEELSTRSMIVPEDMSNLMSADGYGAGSQFGSPSISPTSDTSFSIQAALPPLASSSPAQEDPRPSPHDAESFLDVSEDSLDRPVAKVDWSQDETDTIQANYPQSAFAQQSTSPPTSPQHASPSQQSPLNPPKTLHKDSSRDLPEDSPETSEEDLSVVQWHSIAAPPSQMEITKPFFTPRKPSPLQQEHTLYYDAPSLTHSGSSPSSSALRTASSSSSPVNLPAFLRGPTQDLFAAHSSHTAALLKSLQIHQDLVRDLQSEVAERDEVLQQLREEREQELQESADRERALASRVELLEHTPAAAQAGDISSRDLQIRLEKERHDGEDTRRELQLAREEIARLAKEAELAVQRAEAAEAETREAEINNAHTVKPVDNPCVADLTRQNEELIAARKQVEEKADRAREEIERLQQEVEDAEERLARSQDNADQQNARAEDDAEARLAEQAEEYEERLRNVELSPESESHRLEARVTELEEDNAEWQRVIADIEADLESLRREHDMAKAEHTATLEDLRHVNDDFAALKETSKDQSEAIVKLQREVARLRAESSSKDLDLMNLQKRKAELKEDREMLNIALDSKQQELELIKRKFAVRGVAGSTPAPATVRKISLETPASSLATPMPGTTRSRRRSSMALITPGMDRQPLRSVSAMSSMAKPQVLGESLRQAEVVTETNEPVHKPVGRQLRSREAMLA